MFKHGLQNNIIILVSLNWVSVFTRTYWFYLLEILVGKFFVVHSLVVFPSTPIILEFCFSMVAVNNHDRNGICVHVHGCWW